MRRAVPIVFVVCSLVSCGSDRTGSRQTSQPTHAPASAVGQSLDRATFVREVNEACADYAQRDEALEFPEELDGYAAFMRAFIDNSADLDARLAALHPPPQVEDFDDYIAGNRRQTDVLRAALPKLEAAVADDDQAEADAVIDRAIDDFNAIVDELDPYARRYGFTDCASDPEEDEA